MLTNNQLKELDKLIFPNGRSYLYGALSGQGRVKIRQAVMLYLTGEKLPQAKCSLTALMDLLIEKTEPSFVCHCLSTTRSAEAVLFLDAI